MQIGSSNEDEQKSDLQQSIKFSNIAAFQCTDLPGLTDEMVLSSYDKLIDVQNSEWLKETTETMTKRRLFNYKVRHFRICLDYGPCYEFLCENFQVLAVEKYDRPDGSHNKTETR